MKPVVHSASRTVRAGSPGRGAAPKQDRSVRTRQLVLLKAAECFAENGYADTSVLDVAERAGMTKGAVYHHFPSKEVLAIAVVEEHYARWPVLLAETRTKGLSPFDTVVDLLDGVASAFHQDPIVQAGARLQLERSLIGAPLPAPYVGWTQLITELLADARAAGQLREGVTPEEAARLIVASFFGMQHISDVLNGRADLPERWAELRKLLLSAIRA
ncbi:ScbR family autoregulator-binding transcription factor [Streptomyces sp. NPDC006259]|uniref:ScbR family autoregulator-binding transcription factor n=1 Tax=Streptomyces sp. NPDC006259 TaxID=3364740 RepID=UPI0036C36638